MGWGVAQAWPYPQRLAEHSLNNFASTVDQSNYEQDKNGPGQSYPSLENFENTSWIIRCKHFIIHIQISKTGFSMVFAKAKIALHSNGASLVFNG